MISHIACDPAEACPNDCGAAREYDAKQERMREAASDLYQALRDMVEEFDPPMRREWTGDEQWTETLLTIERARAALAQVDGA